MELNITHLQHYLAYGLKVQASWSIDGFGGTCISEVIGVYRNELLLESHKIYHKHIPYGISLDRASLDDLDTKLLLLPLSALYEEIDGEVGIVELAKMADGRDGWELSDKPKCVIENGTVSVYGAERHNCGNYGTLEFSMFQGEFIIHKNGYNKLFIENPIRLYDYLFSHHYDVYNLINKGLAIDKRKI